MTRTRLLDNIINIVLHAGSIEKATVKIEAEVGKTFDDFESRTCENCRYFTTDDGDDYYCNASSVDNSIVDTLHSYEEMCTFGCNKFERSS